MNQLSESTKLKSSGWINWVNPMRKFSVKISSVNSSVNQLSKSTQWISSVNQLSESIQWRRSYWFTDLMIHWAIDSLNYWFTELLNHWATDLLSYWFTELLIHQANSVSCLFTKLKKGNWDINLFKTPDKWRQGHSGPKHSKQFQFQ